MDIKIFNYNIGSLTFFKEKSSNVFMKNSLLQEEEEYSIFSTKKFCDNYILGSKIGEVNIIIYQNYNSNRVDQQLLKKQLVK